jgi:hypothetical protein
MERDQAIGGAVYLTGALLYAVAIIAGWIFLSSRESSETEVIVA